MVGLFDVVQTNKKIVRVDLSKPRLTAHYLLSQIHDFKLRNYGFDNILQACYREIMLSALLPRASPRGIA